MKINVRIDGIGTGTTSVRIAELRERVRRAAEQRLKDEAARSDLPHPVPDKR